MSIITLVVVTAKWEIEYSFWEIIVQFGKQSSYSFWKLEYSFLELE